MCLARFPSMGRHYTLLLIYGYDRHMWLFSPLGLLASYLRSRQVGGHFCTNICTISFTITVLSLWLIYKKKNIKQTIHKNRETSR